MANKLQKLMINRADFVDSPSNPMSRVVLFKRKVDVAKDAKTVNDILAADEFWDSYYDALGAFSESVSSIMWDSTIDSKAQKKMLKQSVSEISDNLNSLFDSYPITKSENDEIYTKYEKTVDVLAELDTLILSEEFSAEEVTKILEGLEMAEKQVQETVETLKASVTAKDAEITKAQAENTALKAEIEVLKTTKPIEKAAADETVDIWKGVNPEIKKQFEELTKASAESAKIAKAAEENAAVVKLTKRVEDDLKAISGSVDEKTVLLRDVEKMLPSDKFEKLFTILKDASVAIAKSDLLTEKGKGSASGTGNTAFEKLKAKAKELVDSKVAKSDASAMALAAKQNPELYKEYMTEGN